MRFRTEHDSLGAVAVPADALFGPQTARAVANFPISGRRLPERLIRALGLIKAAAAAVNRELGLLDPGIAEAIGEAAREVADGRHSGEFPIDVFQTGSGTSSHMNTNEVIANRATQLLAAGQGAGRKVHPNDHVNCGQSSNDVFPSAIHLAALLAITNDLVPALQRLSGHLTDKARAFDAIVKIARTHLQDATPIRLGQVFSGYAAQAENGLRHLADQQWHLAQLPLGGTAVGTGLNAHPEFGRRIAARLSQQTGMYLVEAPNHFEAQGARDAAVQLSGALRGLACSLSKIANDLRWLGSGPRLGLGELEIPALQPGSSIMPGKVNPVIAESLIMVCAQVIGLDAAIALSGLQGQFELNAMLPLIATNLLDQIELLARGVDAFGDKLVAGIKANVDRIAQRNERSLGLATALVPRLGYDAAARLAWQAQQSDQTIREVCRAQRVLPDEELDRLFDLRRQTEPSATGGGELAPEGADRSY